MLSFIPFISCHCTVNIHAVLEETKWIQAKYQQLTWINSLISHINSALENCSRSKRIEARTNLVGKGNHSKRLLRRHSYLSAQFFISYQFSITIFNKHTFSNFANLYSKKQLWPKIMKHTSKQLKRILLKLVLNIKLNKRKLSKQQNAATIYRTFYSHHYTDM